MKHRTTLWITILALICPSVMAIDVTTSVNEVSHEGDDERIGTFTLTLNENDFSNASEETPIYIRFTLDQFNGWSRTLVDLRDGAHETVDAPINLVLSAGASSSVQTMINPAIPATAVQLVRLIEGERFAWIRVTDSSSDWMVSGNQVTPPNQDLRVSFTLGIRGELSVTDNGNTASGGNERADTGIIASTELRVDYDNTPNFNFGDLDRVFFVAFDHTTSGVEDAAFITSGNPLGIGFSNDFNIARGADFFPCLELHGKVGIYDTPAEQIAISRLNLDAIRSYRADVADLYLTNSSDFAWEAGSRLFLTYQDYNPDYLVYDEQPPFWYDPEEPSTHLLENDIEILVSNGAIWSVSKVYHDDVFMGYELHLDTGLFPVDGYIELRGLVLQSGDQIFEKPLKLSGWGYYLAGRVTSGTPGRIGPLRRTIAEMSPSFDTYFEALPYTAYDRDDWELTTHLANPHDEPTRFTALYYNPSSLLLQVLGSQTLPPNSKRTIEIRHQFGDHFVHRLSWVYIVADKPISAVGVIEDDNEEQLDVYSGIDRLSDKLYIPHLPDDTVSWTTNGYVISTDPDVEATFFLEHPGDTSERLRLIRFPSSTEPLDDDDFLTSKGRSPWASISATEAVGSGLVLYSQAVTGRQLASVSMNTVATRRWRFGHVGRPEAGWWNGLVMVNVRDYDNPVTITAYDDEGAVIATREMTLSSLQRLVDLVENIVSTDTPVARLQILGEENIVCFLLMGRTDTNVLTTIPGNLPEREKLVLPHLPDPETHWAGLALVNEGDKDAAVTVRSYTRDGEPGPSIAFTLDAGRKYLTPVEDGIAGIGPEHTHLIVESDQAISGYLLTGKRNNRQLATIALDGVDFFNVPKQP